MAQFQEAHYHKDETEKRPISQDDIRFLQGLQAELNTQDDMGNRDPRFWMVCQTEEDAVPDGYEDRCVAIDTDGCQSFDTLEEFMACLQEDMDGGVAVSAQPDGSYFLEAYGDARCVRGMQEAVEFLQENGIERYELLGVARNSRIVADTLFLTHRDCEDYLRQYGYNHKPDAHAYAMTAVRSPRYERLIQFLRTVDLSALSAMLRGAGSQG